MALDDQILDEVLSIKLPLLKEPWAMGNQAIRRADSILSGTIVLSSKTTVPFDGNVAWDRHWDTNDRTNRLNLLSMNYVGELLTAFSLTGDRDYLAAAKHILKSYLSKYKKTSKDLQLSSSEDHAHYIRTCVFVKAIQHLREMPEERPLCSDLIDALTMHMRWLYDDSHHVNYNHGVMSDLALIIGYTQLAPIGDEAKNWLDKAYSRLTILLKSAFDVDGMNDENTIGYLRYNIELYNSIIAFSKEYGLGGAFLKRAETTMEKAHTALRYAVWQDGQIPPIGDYSVSPSTAVSINSSKWFKESNIIFIKDERLYISLKCGFSNRSHKQVDETSITVRFDGKDLLVDSGSYNYDRADVYRICAESARGHCGIYPSYMDGVLAAKYVKELHASSRIDFYEATGKQHFVRCNYGLKKGRIWAIRELFVDLDSYTIRIDDTFKSDIPTTFRQQFIFHPDASLEKVGDCNYRGCNGGITFDLANNGSVGHDLFRGETSPIVRGWYFPKYMVKMPTTGLDLFVEGTLGRISTTITMYNSAKARR